MPKKPVERLAYSPDDAAEATGLCRATIYNRIADGSLSSTKVGRNRLISADVLRAFVNGQAAPPRDTA